MNVRVLPATAEVWADVAAVLGGSRRTPDSCWCQRFRHHDEATNKAALRQEVDAGGVAVGLLAYAGQEPVGWSRVAPVDTLPGIAGNTALRRVLDGDDAGWWVTCCVVRRDRRGHGVGAALLAGAVEHARRHQAPVLHGHPVDVAKLKSRPSPAALFTGTLTSFEKAGFDEIGRTYPSRPVMRHALG